MAEDLKHETAPPGLNEKLFLWLTPGLAYYFASRFEEGYCHTFYIPNDFIQVDLATTLTFSAIVLLLLWMFLSWIDGLFDEPSETIKAQLRPWQRILGRYFPFIGLIALFSIVYLGYWHRLSVYVYCVLTIALIDVALGLFAMIAPIPKDMPRRERFLSRPLFIHQTSRTLSLISSRLGCSAFSLFAFVILGSVLAGCIGNAAALNKTSFLVPSSKPDSVVVRSYGDKLICVPLDPTTKKPQKRVFFLSSTDRTLQLDIKTIGPLNFD